MEIGFAIFANVLERDDQGQPINEKHADANSHWRAGPRARGACPLLTQRCAVRPQHSNTTAGRPTAVHPARPAGAGLLGRMLPRDRWRIFLVTRSTFAALAP
jgi:hypothetical protein